MINLISVSEFSHISFKTYYNSEVKTFVKSCAVSSSQLHDCHK